MFKKTDKININAFHMLPFAKSLLQFLQTALIEGAIVLSEQGVNCDQEKLCEILSLRLVEKMKDWKPEYNGVTLLDEKTRLHGARFLTGIAYSLLKEKKHV